MIEVRSRLTERINRAKLKLEVKRSAGSAIVFGIGLLVAVIGAAWIISHVASTLISSSRTVEFAVTDATAVKPGINEVRFEGIPAGQITGTALENGHPIVTVQLEGKFGTIYRNARAELRPNSALEDMYLDITSRGTPNAGVADPNQPLPAYQTAVPVDTGDVLDTFNGATRAHLRTLLAQLGTGLTDRGAQLRTAFDEVAPLLQAASRISEQLALRTPLTRALVHNTAVLTAALGDRTTMLRTLVSSGASTVSALQASSANLNATLHELPGTLDAVDSSFTATQNVLGEVNTAVRSLYPVAGELPRALPAIVRLSRRAAPAVQALQTPVTRLQPLAATLPPLASSLDTAVARLLLQIPVVNRTTADLVACKQGVQGFFQYDASMTKFGDSRGIVPRGNLVVGLQSAGLASPFEYAPQACTPGQAIGGVPPNLANAH